MPQRKCAVKELKKTRTRRLHNLDIKTDLKKTIKAFVKSVDEKKSEEVQTNLKSVYKKLDKASKRNIMHKNTAARRKARFSKLAKSIA